jgi:hypothetical protein
LITAFTVNKSEKIEATITDMRKVPKSFSKTFCDGVSITSHNSEFTAYLFDRQPPQTANLKEVTFRKETRVAYNNYEYWGFYLLSGSVIQVSACPDDSLEFTIIQGKKNFKDFQNGDSLYSCSVYSRSTNCFFNIPATFQYTVEADEEYYLIFSNRVLGSYGIDVVANFTLKRRLYDVGNSESECSNSLSSSSCDLYFPSGNSNPVIILNVTSSSDMEGDSEIDVVCISRDWVYVMIFFLVPLVLGALGTVFIIKKFRKKPRQTATSTQSSSQYSALPSVVEENSSVVPSAPVPGYGAVAPPPKYEDTTGSPPSYEEATK